MKKLNPIVTILIAILITYFLLMTSIRILFTPVFLQIEYRMPGFPPDKYGFTLEERLHWGTESMHYLFDRSENSTLSDLKFDNGQSIYNEREISHMEDVKALLLQTISLWWIVTGCLILLGFIAWRFRWFENFWTAVSYGGWLTVGMIGLILIGVVVNFNDLFTSFHHLFFSGNSWLFYLDDTLIRLFPMRLWQDAFISMGVLTLAGAALCIYFGNKQSKK
ncbi:MAG: TIGR01906 family membrane protein [Anaerolineaceae bacterium]